MKSQRGMAAVMTALMLFVGLVAVLYLWWGEYEQRLALTEDVEQLESSLKSRKRDLQDRTAKLDDEQSTSFRLNQQIRKLKEANKQYQSQVSEADKAADAVKARLSSAEQEVSSLKASLESSNTEKEQAVKDALAESDKEKGLLASELEQAQVKLTAFEEELVTLKSSLELSTKDKDAAFANVKKSSEEMVSLKSANTTLSSEVAKLKQDLSKSKAELKNERSKSAQLQQKIDTGVSQSQAEKKALEKQNQALADDKARLETANSFLEKQVSDLNQSLNTPAPANTKPIDSQVVLQPGAPTQL